MSNTNDLLSLVSKVTAINTYEDMYQVDIDLMKYKVSVALIYCKTTHGMSLSRYVDLTYDKLLKLAENVSLNYEEIERYNYEYNTKRLPVLNEFMMTLRLDSEFRNELDKLIVAKIH